MTALSETRHHLGHRSDVSSSGLSDCREPSGRERDCVAADIDIPATYKVRGAPPRPVTGPARHRWRGRCCSWAHVRWMFVVFGLSGFSGAGGADSSLRDPRTRGHRDPGRRLGVGAKRVGRRDRAPSRCSGPACWWPSPPTATTGSAEQLLDDQLSGDRRPSSGRSARCRRPPPPWPEACPRSRCCSRAQPNSGDLEGELVVGRYRRGPEWSCWRWHPPDRWPGCRGTSMPCWTAW